MGEGGGRLPGNRSIKRLFQALVNTTLFDWKLLWQSRTYREQKLKKQKCIGDGAYWSLRSSRNCEVVGSKLSLVEENERQITVATGTGSQLRFGTSIVEILLSKAAQYELDKVDSNDI